MYPPGPAPFGILKHKDKHLHPLKAHRSTAAADGHSLVVGQSRDVEGLRGAGAQRDGVGLLLGQHGGAMRLVDVQRESVGEAVRDDERQVLQTLQLALLLVTHLQTHRVVALLQLQRVLRERNVTSETRYDASSEDIICCCLYLVWVGVSRSHEPLVLVEQEPELTVKLRLVQ